MNITSCPRHRQCSRRLIRCCKSASSLTSSLSCYSETDRCGKKREASFTLHELNWTELWVTRSVYLPLLIRPQERLWSILMSTSVCVCLSVCEDIFPEPHARSCQTIFCGCCLWPWLGPPPAGWRNPKGRDNFGGFLPHWQCIVQHSVWDPYKNGIDRDAVWDDEWAW